jgi:glycine betaine/proline transport system substrate-binding protein
MKFNRFVGFVVAGVAVSLIATACGDNSTSKSTSSATNAAIKMAVNPWTGSAVNANVAKVVLESKLGTAVTLVDVDENVSWTGLDSGDIDANLEIWPSGHTKDFDNYITQKKSVVELGKLGPKAKIGWYIPQFVMDAHPDLATWEGFMKPENAKLFATADSGDQGQFLMGDPSYVTYDEQVIKNLKLPLKYTVAGSEAALLTAIDKAETDKTPLLMQFWKPHWKHAKVKLAEVKLPDVTDKCLAAATAGDGTYACDYAPDILYKAASAKLQAKNKVAFDFLSKFQLTTEQQNEIAAMIDGDKMSAADAAKKWVAANPDVVKAWLG